VLKKALTILSLFLIPAAAFSQFPQFSLSTDLSIQRSFKKEQRYWAFGHTTCTHFHLTPVDGIYISFVYYSNGKFNNDLTATAKSALTTPQQIRYVNAGNMRLKELSIGWKRYLKGTFNAEKSWNLYGYAGFGLMFGRVVNTHSIFVDTAIYNAPVLSGTGSFKRLTFDLGLGTEVPVGADFFIYTEGRVWIPTTDYPSKFVFVNKKAPLAGMVSLGLRLLF
jgi:hypothetical protein